MARRRRYLPEPRLPFTAPQWGAVQKGCRILCTRYMHYFAYCAHRHDIPPQKDILLAMYPQEVWDTLKKAAGLSNGSLYQSDTRFSYVYNGHRFSFRLSSNDLKETMVPGYKSADSLPECLHVYMQAAVKARNEWVCVARVLELLQKPSVSTTSAMFAFPAIGAMMKLGGKDPADLMEKGPGHTAAVSPQYVPMLRDAISMVGRTIILPIVETAEPPFSSVDLIIEIDDIGLHPTTFLPDVIYPWNYCTKQDAFTFKDEE